MYFQSALLGVVEANDDIIASEQQKLNLAGEMSAAVIRQVLNTLILPEQSIKANVIIELKHTLKLFSASLLKLSG